MENIFQAVSQAHSRIAPYILQTPVEYSPWLSQQTGAKVWLKMEHIQITGSFKLRGAANKILSMTEDRREVGVITASTGNHGAAVAYMCQQLGVPCEIYLPENVSQAKVGLMELYGAQLNFIGEDAIEAELEAGKQSQLSGKPFISPYNDPEVVAGQGTMGKEVAEQLPQVDAIFVPVGGGGLMSGVAGYLKTAKTNIQIIGCQPENSAVMYESIQAGQVVDIPSFPTLSDGTAGGMEQDSITFAICRDLVDDWELMNEEEIAMALRFLLEKHYLMVEGAAGLALACFLKRKEDYKGKTVVLTLCGRKMGLATLKALL